MIEHQSAVLADNFAFLEGPRWHDGTLWVSDMWGHEVLRVTEQGSRKTICAVSNRPSGLGFLPDGSPLVVSMADRKVMRIVDADVELYADLSSMTGGDCNDMLVDEAGRAYVGNFGFDLHCGDAPKKADLLMIESGGSVLVVARDLEFPNGMVLIGGGQTLILAEGWAQRLLAFDRRPDGGLSAPRIYFDMGDRSPDGLCVDEDDGIWVACYDTQEFLRVGKAGTITDRVAVPGRHAVACALGGSDGRTLFCCTFAGDYEKIGSGARRGAIETVRVPIAAVRR